MFGQNRATVVKVFNENKTADIKYDDDVMALNTKFEDLEKTTCVLYAIVASMLFFVTVFLNCSAESCALHCMLITSVYIHRVAERDIDIHKNEAWCAVCYNVSTSPKSPFYKYANIQFNEI